AKHDNQGGRHVAEDSESGPGSGPASRRVDPGGPAGRGAAVRRARSLPGGRLPALSAAVLSLSGSAAVHQVQARLPAAGLSALRFRVLRLLPDVLAGLAGGAVELSGDAAAVGAGAAELCDARQPVRSAPHHRAVGIRPPLRDPVGTPRTSPGRPNGSAPPPFRGITHAASTEGKYPPRPRIRCNRPSTNPARLPLSVPAMLRLWPRWPVQAVGGA